MLILYGTTDLRGSQRANLILYFPVYVKYGYYQNAYLSLVNVNALIHKIEGE